MESCVIELTKATHKYGNINIHSCGKDFFPTDVFGGSSKKDGLGTLITLRVEGLPETIKTDIPTDKNTKHPRWIFRKRAWAKEFVKLHNLKVGDTIVVSRIAPRKYLITPNGIKATRQKYLITPTEGNSDIVNLHQEDLSAYPISLDAIKDKVSNGRKRKRPTSSQLTFGSEAQNNAKKIVNEFNEKIVRIEGDIPVRLPIKKRDRFLFISYDQSAYTHGFHKYPAKFFPELPRWLIKRFSKENDLILDPFSGSGTVNIEALLIRRHSVGIDVDPFSRFVSKVKTTPLPIDELEHSQKRLLTLAS